jgi:hypothetical protein
MSSISRRDLLYSGVALSASSLLVRSAWSRTAAMLADGGDRLARSIGRHRAA